MRSIQSLSLKVLPLLFGAIVGCNAAASDTTSTQAAALQAAQCSVQSFGGVMDQCLSTYDSCAAVQGSDIQLCRQAIAQCAPADPDAIDARMASLEARRPDARGGPRGDEDPHMHGPGPMCDGGPPPPPPPPMGDRDGGPPPPPPPMGDGGHHRGRHEGARGDCAVPHPDREAMQQCRQTLVACLAGDTAVRGCLTAGHECVRTAFQQAFQDACTEATAACSAASGVECPQIAERCAQGVAPVGAPIAGCE